MIGWACGALFLRASRGERGRRRGVCTSTTGRDGLGLRSQRLDYRCARTTAGQRWLGGVDTGVRRCLAESRIALRRDGQLFGLGLLCSEQPSTNSFPVSLVPRASCGGGRRRAAGGGRKSSSILAANIAACILATAARYSATVAAAEATPVSELARAPPLTSFSLPIYAFALSLTVVSSLRRASACS